VIVLVSGPQGVRNSVVDSATSAAANNITIIALQPQEQVTLVPGPPISGEPVSGSSVRLAALAVRSPGPPSPPRPPRGTPAPFQSTPFHSAPVRPAPFHSTPMQPVQPVPFGSTTSRPRRPTSGQPPVILPPARAQPGTEPGDEAGSHGNQQSWGGSGWVVTRHQCIAGHGHVILSPQGSGYYCEGGNYNGAEISF
jgi:hypothetical protein